MKKVYLLGFACMLAGSSALAQVNDAYRFGQDMPMGNIADNALPRQAAPKATNFDRAVNTLFTEDFEGGTGLAFTSGTWTTGGTNGAYWATGNSGNHPFGWTPNLNGTWLQWDSYTPNGSEAQFATTAVDGFIESPNIDLATGASSSNMIINFKTEGMWCCGIDSPPMFMQVSNDAGGNWSAPIPVDLGVDRNESSEANGMPMEITMDLSPYLDATPANNNDVRIRFWWQTTTPDLNLQVSTHYFWQIDDLRIYEVPPYDVEANTLWLADVVADFEYGEIPSNQAPTGTFLTVQEKVTNIGNGTPSNMGLTVEVFDGSMTSVHGPETGGTLTVGSPGYFDIDTITFTTTLDMNTLSVGTYGVRTIVSYTETDEQLENDTLWRYFDITDNDLSHVDYDIQPVFRDNWDDGNGYKIGSFFDVEVDDEVHGMEVFIDAGTTNTPTTTGTQLEFYIHQLDQGVYNEVAGPFTFDLTAGMLDSWNLFNFHQSVEGYPNPYTFTVGNIYVLSFSVVGGDVVWYRYNNFDADFSCRFYYEGDGNWYWQGNEVLLKANFDESLSTGVEYDNNFSIGQNQPNPMNDNSIIRYTLGEASNVSVTFTDASGKVVSTVDKGNQSAGIYTINVDGNDFAEGVYFYTFTIGEKQVTKRMVVTK
jgi:hypothetical protein